tara:strand:- start:101 stop:568 length:468 start_codon:yes stop_codon:yes gene_type:complete
MTELTRSGRKHIGVSIVLVILGGGYLIWRLFSPIWLSGQKRENKENMLTERIHSLASSIDQKTPLIISPVFSIVKVEMNDQGEWVNLIESSHPNYNTDNGFEIATLAKPKISDFICSNYTFQPLKYLDTPLGNKIIDKSGQELYFFSVDPSTECK